MSKLSNKERSPLAELLRNSMQLQGRDKPVFYVERNVLLSVVAALEAVHQGLHWAQDIGDHWRYTSPEANGHIWQAKGVWGASVHFRSGRYIAVLARVGNSPGFDTFEDAKAWAENHINGSGHE